MRGKCTAPHPNPLPKGARGSGPVSMKDRQEEIWKN